MSWFDVRAEPQGSWGRSAGGRFPRRQRFRSDRPGSRHHRDRRDYRDGVPSDFSLKMMNAVHRAAQKITFGRLGWTAMDMPVVELTTIGRKTGRPRTVLLTSPLRSGPGYVVVASRGGDDKPPAWLGNLVANPNVQVSIHGGPPVPMLARVASPVERAAWWPKIVASHRNYGDYQKRTSREIALVVLEPH